eukprot:3757115-Rhodomonas_salina.1
MQHQRCVCLPGYAWDSVKKVCRACPKDTFKAVIGNSEKCAECPSGSDTAKEGYEVCTCTEDGYTMDLNDMKCKNEDGTVYRKPTLVIGLTVPVFIGLFSGAALVLLVGTRYLLKNYGSLGLDGNNVNNKRAAAMPGVIGGGGGMMGFGSGMDAGGSMGAGMGGGLGAMGGMGSSGMMGFGSGMDGGSSMGGDMGSGLGGMGGIGGMGSGVRGGMGGGMGPGGSMGGYSRMVQ